MIKGQFKRIELIFLDKEAAKQAGSIRFKDETDTKITTEKQAKEYRGPVFEEGDGISDLQLTVDSGFVIIHGYQTEGKRASHMVQYMYPADSIARICTMKPTQ